MRHDPRTTYAKTSDIKGRTYLEYRRDMKRKAIAELEALPWIEKILQKYYSQANIRVEKSGGDRFLWFLRRGGVSREADYIAHIGDRQQKIEFQYAEQKTLEFYDFKISKVAKSKDGERVPRSDVLFLYIDKPSQKYTLLEAEWIHQNAEIGEVAAWRTQAYRVPAEKFKKRLIEDQDLGELINRIDAKNALLNFQSKLYQRMQEDLKAKIEEAVAKDKKFSIAPETLEGFFEACFILSIIERCPQQISSWLERCCSFVRQVESLKQAAMVSFSLDFLYFCSSSDEEIDLECVARSLQHLHDFVDRCYTGDGAYKSGDSERLCEDTQYALFVINIVEDITQDMLYYHSDALPKSNPLKPISQIFQLLREPLKTARYIQQQCISEE